MAAAETMFDKARVVVLFGFCLINPFAGWAYLAQLRDPSAMRPPAIADTVKPRKLAVLPLATGTEAVDDDWAATFEIDFLGYEDVSVVPLERTAASLDPERDVLALGRRVHADLVLDARAFVDEIELKVYARLIRMADATVRWSELFVGEPGDLAEIRERIRVSLLRCF